ncbi:MAG TPA: NTP transferase domain-containing protein [Myxococcales bacterium]
MVLAGGESRRFGSDKALALFRGEPLLAHVLRGVRGFAQVVLTAKQPEKYAAFEVERVRDGHAAQTPLAGLAAGLLASRFELVFACAADMPFAADEKLLRSLFEAIDGHDVAVPAGQPLCAVWRRDPALLAAGSLLTSPNPPGPRALWPLLRTAHIDWPDSRPFLDADTPDALRGLGESG